MRDYYATLQVDPAADPEVIEAAYRRLARKWHPDTNTSPDAAARMRDLNEAYHVLGDPTRRRVYDAGRQGPATVGARPPPRGVLPAAVITVGLLAGLVGLRIVGALIRVPIILAAVIALACWALSPRRRVWRGRSPVRGGRAERERGGR